MNFRALLLSVPRKILFSFVPFAVITPHQVRVIQQAGKQAGKQDCLPLQVSIPRLPKPLGLQASEGAVTGVNRPGIPAASLTETLVCRCKAGDLRDRSTRRDPVCSCMQRYHNPDTLPGFLSQLLVGRGGH